MYVIKINSSNNVSVIIQFDRIPLLFFLVRYVLTFSDRTFFLIGLKLVVWLQMQVMRKTNEKFISLKYLSYVPTGGYSSEFYYDQNSTQVVVIYISKLLTQKKSLDNYQSLWRA